MKKTKKQIFITVLFAPLAGIGIVIAWLRMAWYVVSTEAQHHQARQWARRLQQYTEWREGIRKQRR